MSSTFVLILCVAICDRYPKSVRLLVVSEQAGKQKSKQSKRKVSSTAMLPTQILPSQHQIKTHIYSHTPPVPIHSSLIRHFETHIHVCYSPIHTLRYLEIGQSKAAEGSLL